MVNDVTIAACTAIIPVPGTDTLWLLGCCCYVPHGDLAVVVLLSYCCCCAIAANVVIAGAIATNFGRTYLLPLLAAIAIAIAIVEACAIGTAFAIAIDIACAAY